MSGHWDDYIAFCSLQIMRHLDNDLASNELHDTESFMSESHIVQNMEKLSSWTLWQKTTHHSPLRNLKPVIWNRQLCHIRLKKILNIPNKFSEIEW